MTTNHKLYQPCISIDGGPTERFETYLDEAEAYEAASDIARLSKGPLQTIEYWTEEVDADE